jgi:hypothetical protein
MRRTLYWLAAIALGVACRNDDKKPSASEIATEALSPHVEIDVPVLATTNGTREPAGGESRVTLTGAPDEVTNQRAAFSGHGPTLVAIAPKLSAQRVMLGLDALYRLGVRHVEVLVRVKDTRRVIVIEENRPRSSNMPSSVAVISVGAAIKINEGDAITLEALPQTLSRLKPDSIVVLPEPDLEMQRLAEVIAACGGDVWLGSGTLPRVEPPPSSTP